MGSVWTPVIRMSGMQAAHRIQFVASHPPATAGGTDRIQVRLLSVEMAHGDMTGVQAFSWKRSVPPAIGSGWEASGRLSSVCQACRLRTVSNLLLRTHPLLRVVLTVSKFGY